MKKLMMILMCMMSMTVFAQDKPPVQVATTMIQNQNAKFQLFPTQNRCIHWYNQRTNSQVDSSCIQQRTSTIL